MGQKSSILAVKKRHINEWANFFDGSNEMVRSLRDSREVLSHTDDNVLRGAQTSFPEDLKDFVKQSYAGSSLAASMKERITERISNIASTVFISGNTKKKEVKSASGRQAFISGGQEMCFLLVLTYVATRQAGSSYKFRFRITYAVYQSSLPVDQLDQETRSADEVSDMESNPRRSTHSNTSGDVLSVSSSRSAIMGSAKGSRSSMEPSAQQDSSETRKTRPVSASLLQGDTELRSSQADVNL